MIDYRTDAPIQVLDDHNCFGCGALNPIGLHLHFYRIPEENAIWAEWMPTSDFEGYNGMIHGGIICTLLDEITAWALYDREIWAVTAKMQTSFRKPVQVGQPVRLVGRILRDRGRVIELKGEVRNLADDTLLAEAEAVFMRVPESQAQQWNQRYLSSKEQW